MNSLELLHSFEKWFGEYGSVSWHTVSHRSFTDDKEVHVTVPSKNPCIPDSLTVFMSECGLLGATWFQLPGGGIWDYDWVFYMGDLWTRLDWSSPLQGFEIVETWLKCLFNEEIVATYSGAGSGPYSVSDLHKIDRQTNLIRSWRGTYDHVPASMHYRQ